MTSIDAERRAIARRIAAASRVLVVVAGSNGAGKTTFVDTFLRPLGLRTVNPDAIAQALFPERPVEGAYEAARAADVVRGDLLDRGVSFCMETVFSDAEGAKVAFIERAQAEGYVVVLVFIGLESPELAVARVVERVEQGGHDVPDEKIVSRYPRTLRNLRKALTIADHAFLFDNSSAEEPYRFAAELRAGRVLRRGSVRPRWCGTAGL